MAEPYTSHRASFPKGKQSLFLEKISRQFSVKEVAGLCQCSERTIRDWRREKYSMTSTCVELLCKSTDQVVPSEMTVISRSDTCRKAASLGGRAKLQKYGAVCQNESFRRTQWKKWWNNTGMKKLPAHMQARPIRKPRHSALLAEFIGIMLGDGGMSNYQLRVSLHRKDDKKYVVYVSDMINKLFQLKPAIYNNKEDAACDVCVSRVDLIRFCENIGLKKGNKVRNQVAVPLWIRENHRYSIACLRGLLDTDGSVYLHRYQVNGRHYKYKKLSFTSCSRPLIRFVTSALNAMHMRPRVTTKGNEVRLESVSDMKAYFDVVGSSNPKHLNNYRK